MSTECDVACFGELLWDFFEIAEKDGRTYRRELGGASANVSVALAKLGIAVRAVGAVGDDKLGDTLRNELEAAKVDIKAVRSVKGLHSGITFVTRDATGEPSFVPYRQGTADLALDEADVPATAAKVRFAVLSSTSMLPSLRPATMKFIAAVEKAKGAIVVDLNARAHLWESTEAMREGTSELAKKASVVKASERDLGALAGKRGMSWLEEHAKGATWVLTRGENGAACVGPHGQVMAPTKRVRCIDATGAGDAFVAGLVAVLVRAGAKPGSAEWKDPKLWTRGLEVGHLLGAKVVSAIGATAALGALDDLRARIDAPKK